MEGTGISYSSVTNYLSVILHFGHCLSLFQFYISLPHVCYTFLSNMQFLSTYRGCRGWIYNDLCNQCLSPLVVSSNPANGEMYAIQHYVLKFVSFSGTPVSSTNKTGRHDMTKILLNTITSLSAHLIIVCLLPVIYHTVPLYYILYYYKLYTYII